MKEYVIWGIPASPHPAEDTLLLATIHGEKITDKAIANKKLQELKTMGCTNMRIQEIDLSKPLNWLESIGLKKKGFEKWTSKSK